MKSKPEEMKNQVAGEEISLGVDMGGTVWAVSTKYGPDRPLSYRAYRDQDGVSKEEIFYRELKKHIDLGRKAHVYYEAGRYGFTPARIMMGIGAEVTIVPVSKLEIYSCGKRVKTDRLDSRILACLKQYCAKIPSVYIPTVKEEEKRSAERERERLNAEIKRLNNQMISIVERTELPTPCFHKTSEGWLEWLQELDKTGEISKIPRTDKRRFANFLDELRLFEGHRKSWEKFIEEELEAERLKLKGKNEQSIYDRLISFKGIGPAIARHLSWEIGDFRRFRNGKAFGSYFGLASCHYASGNMDRDQGIAKSGRSSLRKMAIEMAWLFVHHQPGCWAVKKWAPELEKKGRNRRKAIVALARQLLVALWRHIVYGEEIEGAIINRPLKANV